MSRRVAPVLLLAATLVLASGCQRHKPPATTDLLYVDRIEAPATASAGTFFVVRISGNLPDPSWTWVRNAIATADSEVRLSIYGQRDPSKMAAQVLTPYQATQRIRKLHPGPLKIVAIGKDRQVETTVRVEAP